MKVQLDYFNMYEIFDILSLQFNIFLTHIIKN